MTTSPPTDAPPLPAGASDAPDAPTGGVPFAGLRLAALIAGLVALGVWNPWMLVVIMALVVMITLHEFGHYITAKRAGMKVTEFFLFFGPKVWSIQRGETEYGIKCIPAGAYVKIIGMTNLEEVPAADEGRTYRQKSFGRRVSVAVAGSTMHFLLAIGLIFVALVAVGQPAGSLDQAEQARAWHIGSVEEGSGADAAGLESGDRITRLDGTTIETFDDVRTVSREAKGTTVPLTYVRDGQSRDTEITLKPFYSWGVARVTPDTGPADAGLEVGDQLTSIDGTTTRDLKNLDDLLADVEGRTVPVTFERYDVDAEAVQTASGDLLVESLVLAGSEGYLGVTRQTDDPERISPLSGLVQAPAQFLDVTGSSLKALGSFFSPGGISDFAGQVGDARDDDAGLADGPRVPTSDETSATLLDRGSGTVGENRILSIYGLVRIGSDAGAVDPTALISLFAFINIFIGVFNLIPLLPFDGGHVMIAAYEKVQERRLHKRRYFTDVARLMPVTYVVVLLLGMLFVSSLYLDIANPLSV